MAAQAGQSTTTWQAVQAWQRQQQQEARSPTAVVPTTHPVAPHPPSTTQERAATGAGVQGAAKTPTTHTHHTVVREVVTPAGEAATAAGGQGAPTARMHLVQQGRLQLVASRALCQDTPVQQDLQAATTAGLSCSPCQLATCPCPTQGSTRASRPMPCRAASPWLQATQAARCFLQALCHRVRSCQHRCSRCLRCLGSSSCHTRRTHRSSPAAAAAAAVARSRTWRQQQHSRAGPTLALTSRLGTTRGADPLMVQAHREVAMCRDPLHPSAAAAGAWHPACRVQQGAARVLGRTTDLARTRQARQQQQQRGVRPRGALLLLGQQPAQVGSQQRAQQQARE